MVWYIVLVYVQWLLAHLIIFNPIRIVLQISFVTTLLKFLCAIVLVKSNRKEAEAIGALMIGLDCFFFETLFFCFGTFRILFRVGASLAFSAFFSWAFFLTFSAFSLATLAIAFSFTYFL